MRIGYLFSLLALTLPIVSTTRISQTQSNPRISRDLQLLKDSANKAFISGDLVRACPLYNEGLLFAIARHELRAVARFRHGIGNCRLLTADYRGAVQEYLEARHLSASNADWEMVGLLSTNLFTVYSRIGDRNAALESMREAIRVMPAGSSPENMPRLLVNMATAESELGHFDRALVYYYSAIDTSDRNADLPSLVQAWGELGSHWVRRGKLDAAERAYSRAFYLRKLLHIRGLADSYRDLGIIRNARGDPQSALRLLNAGLEIAKHAPIDFPAFYLYYHRARARAALNDLPGSLADSQAALELARNWRLGVVPADGSRTAADVSLQRIYSDYIQTGMKLYHRHPNPALAYRMFQAAEENRAASFQERLAANKTFPPEYWQLLAKLRAAEIALFRKNEDVEQNTVARLRLELSQFESQLGNSKQIGDAFYSPRINESNRSVKSLLHFQRLITDQEALISFHLGEKESYAWAITKNRFEVHTLPSRSRMALAVGQFRQSIQAGTPNSTGLGQKLYSDLFGAFHATFTSRPSWLLVLDHTLFELPFGALVIARTGPTPLYLIERNSVRVIPAAGMLGTPEPAMVRGPFLGIGDPIYNAADSRWTARETRSFLWARITRVFHLGDSNSAGTSWELARLAGSGREIEVSARAWSSESNPVLLYGKLSERNRIERSLRDGPAIAHFATHVVQPVDQPDQAMIAIGLDSSGSADFLTATEISSRRYPLGLVVLSGCSSGAGKALPGAGLFGLTGAWLLAGARAVTASQWPTPDDSGVLFQDFYDYFNKYAAGLTSASAANALRSAQMKMLRSGNWRAQPRFWAAFFVVGKD